MGFLPDIRRIIGRTPRERQNLLFSATMPYAMQHLADDILRDPVRVEASRVSSAATTIEHFVHFVEKWDKPKYLARLLAEEGNNRCLVFTRTKRGADRLVRELSHQGIRAAALHGDKTQGIRTRTLEEFRSGKNPILVATDIAARGLDIDEISHVYNYDLSHEPEAYVHRIGRSGRAGATGIAISLCSIEERAHLRAIEKLVGQPLQRVSADGTVEAVSAAATATATAGASANGKPAAAAPSRRSRRGRSAAFSRSSRSRW
jgi:ATP-dependent RNA helicase RhlE